MKGSCIILDTEKGRYCWMRVVLGWTLDSAETDGETRAVESGCLEEIKGLVAGCIVCIDE